MSNQALLTESQVLRKLYDAEAMMAIPPSVGKGFIVLLSGGTDHGTTGKKSPNTKQAPQQEKDVSLAFMALVQGNVLDTCFGVVNAARREDTPATRASREAKQLLEESATTDRFRVCAVEAYHEAFNAVVDYRTEDEKLNCITRCFRAKKLRDTCEKNLRESFLGLAKAVTEQP